MQKRLFIIKNTTHYLAAKNYIEAKPQAENYIFLTVGKFTGYKSFIKAVRQNDQFRLLGIIYTHNQGFLSNYIEIVKNLIRVKKIASKITSFDEIIITNYKLWVQHFVLNHFKTKRIVLMSDGTAILSMANYRKKERNIPLEIAPFGGNRFLMEHVFKVKPIKNLRFYSPLAMEIASYDSLEIFNFKTGDAATINSEKIYIVGSPLVELKYLSKTKNLYYLKEIAAYFKNKNITYFAHRRELDYNLKDLDFFTEIVKNEIPFEEMLERETELPAVIISYFSSVLINLAPVYPQIKFYYIPLDETDLSENPVFKSEYKIMMEGFEKIKEKNFQNFKKLKQVNPK